MSLQSDIKDVFTADMTNDSFADGIADAIKSFVSGCSFTVTPSPVTGTDSSPTGTFTGSATVSWQITGTKIADSIKAVMSDMDDQKKGDSDLAQAIADGLDDDEPEWTVTLNGSTVTTTTPPQTVTPITDSGSVTSTFVSATVKSGLETCFTAMEGMTSGGDDYFATQLATLVTTYYTGSTNKGQGATHLSGCQFTIKVVAGS